MTIMLQFGEGHSHEEWRDALLHIAPDLDIRVWPDVGNESEIDVAVVWIHQAGTLKGFENLKVICNLGAGVERILNDADLPTGVPITRIVNPRMTGAMSEYILLHVLRYHRHFAENQANQASRHWDTIVQDDAAKTTVGLMGLGELGQDAAAKLHLLGFDVAGWSRSEKSLAHVTTYHGDDGLMPFLGSLKILICLLPLTPETTGIINRRNLEAVPDGSFFINAARGGHVVDDDLLWALNSDKLAGVTLDVFNTEPLPADHAYWSHPKMTITPHNAADSFPEDVAPQIVENIRRALSGRDLINQIDLDRGY